jgi:release factor glutamine methyltransferase
MKVLKPSGMLITEINERMGEAVAALFSREGFSHVQIIKDLDGKDRIVKGYKIS